MVVSPGIPEFFHSDSTSFNARLQPNESGGTPVLVVKSKSDTKKAWPALGVLARGALSLMGRGGAKAAAGKGAQVGVKGAAGTAGAAGGAAATMPKPPAGSATTTLQPSEATSGSSMASQSSAKGASQPNVQTSDPMDYVDESTTQTPWKRGGAGYEQARSQPTSGFSKIGVRSKDTASPKDVPSLPDDAMSQEQIDLASESADIDSAIQEATGKQEQAQKRRDRAQNIGGAAYIGGSYGAERGRAKNAEQRAEMERIERLAQDGRAKGGTGSKVAVSS